MSRQIDKKRSKQVRIDKGLHYMVKIKAAEEKKTIKELVEGCLIDYLGPITEKERE